MHFSTYNNYEHLSQSGDNNKHYNDHSNKITKLIVCQLYSGLISQSMSPKIK